MVAKEVTFTEDMEGKEVMMTSQLYDFQFQVFLNMSYFFNPSRRSSRKLLAFNLFYKHF
jgi:hypothetical protein